MYALTPLRAYLSVFCLSACFGGGNQLRCQAIKNPAVRPEGRSYAQKGGVMNYSLFWLIIHAYKNQSINRQEFIEQWGRAQAIEAEFQKLEAK